MTMKHTRRTLELFELFAKLRRPANVTEIYKSLGFPQSTTSKLLKTYTQLGYLRYDPTTRTFVPTLRAALLGEWLHDRWFNEESFLSTMNRLQTELGANVFVGIQSGPRVLYVL